MTRWRDETQARAWRTYIEASIRLETRIEEELRATTGLTLIDYHVLVRLSEAPGHRLRMGELAEQLVFSPSRLTYQVGSMEKRGLVLRERSSEDGRGMRAVLTATGLQALRDAAPRHRRAVRNLWMDDLTAAETRCITRVFDRIGRQLGVPPIPADVDQP